MPKRKPESRSRQQNQLDLNNFINYRRERWFPLRNLFIRKQITSHKTPTIGFNLIGFRTTTDVKD